MTRAYVLMVLVIMAGGPAVSLDAPVSGLFAAAVGSMLYGVLHGLVAMLAGAATGRRLLRPRLARLRLGRAGAPGRWLRRALRGRRVERKRLLVTHADHPPDSGTA